MASIIVIEIDIPTQVNPQLCHQAGGSDVSEEEGAHLSIDRYRFYQLFIPCALQCCEYALPGNLDLLWTRQKFTIQQQQAQTPHPPHPPRHHFPWPPWPPRQSPI